jgi:hypothetical protein
VGLRGSGKTSYLAALWHEVEAGEIPTALTSSELQPDREHLNQIREKWLSFQEVGRTSLRSQETVSLLLRDVSGAKVDVVVPDLSGELYRLQWVNRKVTRSYADFAAQSCGALLLIHPGAVVKSERILALGSSEIPSSGGSLPPPNAFDSESSTPPNAKATKEWTPEVASTQVQLIELLQFISFLRPMSGPFRIAVIVSAWDLISEPILPISWLETHLPLLYQYVVANAAAVPFRVYGVSALGGDLAKDLGRLQNEVVPSRRIKVVEDRPKPHGDLTAPIQFLLDLNSAHANSV